MIPMAQNSENIEKACPERPKTFPELMTESEVIQLLRIPEVSNSENHHNVIEHLKKVRGLPRIHICHKVLYPKKAVLEWVEKETDVGN